MCFAGLVLRLSSMTRWSTRLLHSLSREGSPLGLSCRRLLRAPAMSLTAVTTASRSHLEGMAKGASIALVAERSIAKQFGDNFVKMETTKDDDEESIDTDDDRPWVIDTKRGHEVQQVSATGCNRLCCPGDGTRRRRTLEDSLPDWPVG